MTARWFHHVLIAALVGASIAFSSPVAHIGGAAHYNVGRIERTADIRGMAHTSCMASSPLYPLGTWLRVERIATGRVELCRTVDVSAPQHRARQIARGIVIELGWPAARRLCGLSRVNQEPPRACQVRVVRI